MSQATPRVTLKMPRTVGYGEPLEIMRLERWKTLD
jgi:hypothetical protein